MAVLFGKKNPSGGLSTIFRSRTFWISIAIVLVLCGTVAGGRWAHGKWTNRQSWKLAGLAEQHVREGRTNEALMSLETSLRLRPDNPSALRQLARLRSSLGQRQEALAAWQKLSEANALTAADAQNYALLAGLEGEWAIANRIIDRFRAGNQGPEPDLLRANILGMRGDTAAAEKSLRQAVEKDETERSRAILARFLLANRLDKSTAPEILALHRDLIELPNETGAQALAGALLAGIVPPDERASWIESLRNHPKTTPALRLAADSAEAASNPAAAPILAAQVFSRLEKSPVEERRLGFLWLTRHNQPFRALRLLTRDEAIADPGAFRAWLEALAATSQADKIPEALDLPANPLPSHRTALHRARAMQLLGKKDATAEALASALAASSGNTTQTLEVLTYLHDTGETALFETEFTKLLATPETARPALEALRPVVAKRRDIEALRHFHTLAFPSPGALNKTQIQNEIDYCDLVLGRPVEIAPLAELALRNPNNLAFRTTHALALFRSGKNASALSELVIAGDSTADPALLARRATIEALALTASGDPLEAEKLLATLDPALLTRQETDLLRATQPTPEAVAALVERAKATPAESRHRTAARLASQENFDAALALLPLDEALASPDLFLFWINANSATKNWRDTLAALQRPENPLPPHLTRLLTGWALERDGRPDESQAAFAEAIREAGNDPAKFAETTLFLFSANETALFESCLAKIPEAPSLAPALYRSLLPAARQQRDAALTLRLLETLAPSTELAGDPAFQNDLAHHRLLLGKPAPIEFLRQHREKNPDDLATLSTLAFDQLQNGAPPAALALFESYGPDVDARSLPPAILAIYAATLAANGQTDLSRTIASFIPRGSLSKQMASFLSSKLAPAN